MGKKSLNISSIHQIYRSWQGVYIDNTFVQSKTNDVLTGMKKKSIEGVNFENVSNQTP